MPRPMNRSPNRDSDTTYGGNTTHRKMRLYPFRPHKYRTAAPRNRTFHERYSPISQNDTKRKNPLWDKHSRNAVGRQCFCRNTQTMRTIAVIKRDKCPSIGPYRHTRIPIQCTAEIPSIGQSPPGRNQCDKTPAAQNILEGSSYAYLSALFAARHKDIRKVL